MIEELTTETTINSYSRDKHENENSRENNENPRENAMASSRTAVIHMRKGEGGELTAHEQVVPVLEMSGRWL